MFYQQVIRALNSRAPQTTLFKAICIASFVYILFIQQNNYWENVCFFHNNKSQILSSDFLVKNVFPSVFLSADCPFHCCLVITVQTDWSWKVMLNRRWIDIPLHRNPSNKYCIILYWHSDITIFGEINMFAVATEHRCYLHEFNEKHGIHEAQ